MPLVFIHGVNTREGDKYNPIRDHLVAQLKERVLAPLGWPSMSVTTPYWGKFGVVFHWRPDEKLEVITNLKFFENNPASVLDAVEMAAAEREFAGLTPAERQAVVSAVSGVVRDRAKLESAVFERASEADAAEALGSAIQERVQATAQGEHEARRYERMPVISHLFDRTARIATVIASNRLRQRLQVNLSRFMGDAFVYARDRGTPEQPGAIIRTVASALHEAQAVAKAKHEPLIVVTYSMGGNIFYDIATAFDEEAAACAAWVAVGSQVSHFEDMKLFYASVEDIRHPKRVDKPPQVEAWFNLHDAHDPCAFAAEPVFKGVRDVRYPTGVSAFTVHGAYFEQPGFYDEIYELLRPILRAG
ncbi:MAG TPA: hypothetical protein VJR89_10365 [Polyangiales bacterium]|nr:hypothetical protein [Polyangiales bacterium]